MSAGQLWLFDPPKPLVERFGEEFFRTLPSGPGVYLMCGECEGVLYVGKARNLRKRLSSYRVANPERMARRIIRLLHRVTRIEFDVCPTEAAAIHREELLICVLAPKFNAAGKVWPARGRGWRPLASWLADKVFPCSVCARVHDEGAMATDEHSEPAARAAVQSKLTPESSTGAEANPVAVPEESVVAKLTPEEQMALFEKNLKENDWGHQPC